MTETTTSTSFYNFSAKLISGEEVSMETYRGKVVLVVNTASACGFTPQYAGLETLYNTYKDRGLVILGFPCNQFGQQEPGSEEEIQDGCLSEYGISFPMFLKIEVNGKNTHPLFRFLKTQASGFLGNRIKWNFTKFLIDSNGNPVERFAPTTTPGSIESAIVKLLPDTSGA